MDVQQKTAKGKEEEKQQKGKKVGCQSYLGGTDDQCWMPTSGLCPNRLTIQMERKGAGMGLEAAGQRTPQALASHH